MEHDLKALDPGTHMGAMEKTLSSAPAAVAIWEVKQSIEDLYLFVSP